MRIPQERLKKYKPKLHRCLYAFRLYEVEKAVQMLIDKGIAEKRFKCKGRYYCPNCLGDGCYIEEHETNYCQLCGQRFDMEE